MKNNNELAPIVLFVYNRFDHTKKTIEALQKNIFAKESELYIYSDGPKNNLSIVSVEKIRSYIKSVDGFKKITIIEREKNFGLANSIINGVTFVINRHKKVIVLEDDLITGKYFLDYMNRALNTYKNREDIFSITGFNFSSEFMQFSKDYKEDIYLNIRPMSWSWATWIDRWENVDWDMNEYETFIRNIAKKRKLNRGGTDLTRMLKSQMNGKIDSWYIRWSFHAIMKDILTVYPRISYVNNLGHDASGTHGSKDEDKIYGHTELNIKKIERMDLDIKINSLIVKQFNKGFNLNYYAYVKRKILDFLN